MIQYKQQLESDDYKLTILNTVIKQYKNKFYNASINKHILDIHTSLKQLKQQISQQIINQEVKQGEKDNENPT